MALIRDRGRRRGSLAAPVAAHGGSIAPPPAPPQDGEMFFWGDANGDAAGAGAIEVSGYFGGSSAPRGVAANGQYVYWVNFANGTIGRCNRNGTAAVENWITLDASHHQPYGLAISDKYIYWTDLLTPGVGRANLDGSDVRPDFFRFFGSSYTLAQMCCATLPFINPFDVGAEEADALFICRRIAPTVYVEFFDVASNDDRGDIAVIIASRHDSGIHEGQGYLVDNSGGGGSSLGYGSFMLTPFTPRGLDYPPDDLMQRPEAVTCDGTSIFWTNTRSAAICTCPLYAIFESTGVGGWFGPWVRYVCEPGTVGGPLGITYGNDDHVYWVDNATRHIGRVQRGAVPNGNPLFPNFSRGVDPNPSWHPTNFTNPIGLALG